MLERLAARHEITSLLTRPDAPRGRGQKTGAPPAKETAERLGIRVLLGDEATVKRIKYESGGRVKLMPANSAYEPIEVNREDSRVIGKVIGLMRNYSAMH